MSKNGKTTHSLRSDNSGTFVFHPVGDCDDQKGSDQGGGIGLCDTYDVLVGTEKLFFENFLDLLKALKLSDQRSKSYVKTLWNNYGLDRCSFSKNDFTQFYKCYDDKGFSKASLDELYYGYFVKMRFANSRYDDTYVERYGPYSELYETVTKDWDKERTQLKCTSYTEMKQHKKLRLHNKHLEFKQIDESKPYEFDDEKYSTPNSTLKNTLANQVCLQHSL